MTRGEGAFTEGQPPPVVGVGANSNLRKDVLKQAVSSLAAAIGSIRYADDVHISASEKITLDTCDLLPENPKASGVGSDDGCGVAQIFSVQQMSAAVQHAN